MAAGAEMLQLPLFGEQVDPGLLPEQAAPPRLEVLTDESEPAPPPWHSLVMHPVLHVADIDRFWSKVVKGPGSHCWIWTGAISDDGYGTFSLTRDGVEETHKAHRVACAIALGIPIARGRVVEHVTCDNPICCRSELDPSLGHIWPSTQAENLARMARKRRTNNLLVRGWASLARHERAERSRALRAAVRDGWNEARVRAVLMSIDPAQVALF